MPLDKKCPNGSPWSLVAFPERSPGFFVNHSTCSRSAFRWGHVVTWITDKTNRKSSSQVQIEPLSHHSQDSKYKSISQACRVIFKEEGMLGFWKGHNPAQVLSIGYGVTQFSVYEFLKEKSQSSETLIQHPQLRSFMCGGAAGAVASVVATPLDVIRTRIIVQDQHKGYRNSIQATKFIYREDGLRGFYRGFVPSLWQIIPLAGLNFLFYNFYCSQLQQVMKLERHEWVTSVKIFRGRLLI